MYENQPWLKFYGSAPASLNYPDLSIYSMVKKSCENRPDIDACVFFKKITKKSEFLQRTDLMSRKFAQLGIKKGDTVIICLPNIPQAVISIYALNRLGAIPAPIHPLSASPEIEAYAKLVDAKTAITLDGFFPRFKEIIKSTGFTKVIVCSLKPEMDLLTKIGFSIGPGRKIKPVNYDETVIDWEKLELGGEALEIAEVDPVKADELALILFSGGTTSSSKAVMLSNRNCNALAMQMNAVGGPLDPGDKMLSILPVFHGFGLAVGIHSFLIHDSTCILVPKFKADTLAALVKKHKPHYIAGVPTLFDALAADKNFGRIPLNSFKGIFCGGDSLSPEIKERFEAVLKKSGSNVMLREGYGLTETVTACAIVPRNEYRERTFGVPCPDNWLKVVKMDTEEECAPMEAGEICVTGPTLMLGYYNDKEATDSVVKKHKDGKSWLHTGDIGCMDSDGFFYFKQRAKRIIKTSGIAIYPSQIEDVLNQHPDVRLSCVIGIPDPTKGEVPKAFIMLKEKSLASKELEQEIIDNCKKKLNLYSCPRSVEFIEEMPMTKVGKVAYRELEELERSRR